jgi:integrase
VAAYKSAFQSYKIFIAQVYGPNTTLIPPSLEHLASFIAHCYQINLAASTTRTVISALSFVFQLGSCTDLTQHFVIKKMLQGFQKAKPSCDPRLPITPEILQKLIQALPYTADSYFSQTLLRAMFILAYCTFLRVGEITKTNSKTHHYLLAKHVSMGIDAEGLGFLDITIPHFKHSNSNAITIHLAQNNRTPLLCPYQALTDFLRLRKHHSPDPPPLFSFMDDTPVLRQYFTSQLRLALKFNNLNLAQYQAHSFRIGAATTAAANGYTEIQIQNMGRWKSNAYRKYIRIPSMAPC